MGESGTILESSAGFDHVAGRRMKHKNLMEVLQDESGTQKFGQWLVELRLEAHAAADPLAPFVQRTNVIRWASQTRSRRSRHSVRSYFIVADVHFFEGDKLSSDCIAEFTIVWRSKCKSGSSATTPPPANDAVRGLIRQKQSAIVE